MTTVIVTIILNQKSNRPWYYTLINYLVRMKLPLVFMNDCVLCSFVVADCRCYFICYFIHCLSFCTTMGIYSSGIIYTNAAIRCHGISFSTIPRTSIKNCITNSISSLQVGFPFLLLSSVIRRDLSINN